MPDKMETYKHNFSEDELNQMLYLWDETASISVNEYLYMKKEWLRPAIDDRSTESLRINWKDSAVDTGERTTIALSHVEFDDEEVVYLDLDTFETVHIVEFYAPWCAHCLAFKHEYVELAAEVMERSSGGVQVKFHALSCELFRTICRVYGISGFPFVAGYPLHADIRAIGIELNPEDGPEMTAETIANDLQLTQAAPLKTLDTRTFSNSDDRRVHEASLTQKAADASKRKHSWQSYPSTIDERYHNAAVSLVFVLKDGVYIDGKESLDDKRAMALKEFLELLDWTLPQAWHIRTTTRSLIDNLSLIVSGSHNLVNLLDQHIAHETGDTLWGGLDPNFLDDKATSGKPSNVLVRENTRWTEACTHSERSLGFACGLWNLFHIVSLGAAKPEHQMYGFLSGYLTSPADVAEILKRFIVHFFGCDVCRRHFVDNFDDCGQNHCERLPTIMPLLDSHDSLAWEPHVEFARWLLEMHNDVNVHLMVESAEREGRKATREETLSAIFPPTELCSDCWLHQETLEYEVERMILFLDEWYWPEIDKAHPQFQSVLSRHTYTSRTAPEILTAASLFLMTIMGFGVAVFAAVLFRPRFSRSSFSKTL